MVLAVRILLRVAAAVGLAVDAGVHADLAGQYDAVTATISEGTLFRIEAGAAALSVVLVLVLRRWLGDLFAAGTAAAGIAAILVFRYVDVGAFGPFPNMYEPIWSDQKVLALAAQILAVLALLPLLARRRSAPPSPGTAGPPRME